MCLCRRTKVRDRVRQGFGHQGQRQARVDNIKIIKIIESNKAASPKLENGRLPMEDIVAVKLGQTRVSDHFEDMHEMVLVKKLNLLKLLKRLKQKGTAEKTSSPFAYPIMYVSLSLSVP